MRGPTSLSPARAHTGDKKEIKEPLREDIYIAEREEKRRAADAESLNGARAGRGRERERFYFQDNGRQGLTVYGCSCEN